MKGKRALIPLIEQPAKEEQTGALLPASKAAYDAAVMMDEPKAKVLDSFSNPVAQLGFGTKNLLEATEYPLTRMTDNYALLNSLFRGNWIVQNIVSMIPEDMTKKWFTIKSQVAPEEIDKIEKLQRQTKLRRAIIEGMNWGRLYGGAVGLMLLEGQENYEEPLDYDSIAPDSFKGLYIVDRWSGVYPDLQLITDISDPDFGLPAFYEIRDAADAVIMRVHHSRVIRFTGRELPYWEKQAELYWGQSEIEAVYQEVVKRDNVSYNLAALTFKANLSVYEMENVDQVFGIASNQAQKRFWNTLQAQAAIESNMGIRVVNKGDKIERQSYSFTGLPEVYDSMMMDVSGASRIPMTKLFGRSPAGMNATGESDLQNYYDYVDELRESQFRPIIEKILPILAMSAWGQIPDDLDFYFEAIQTPSETEKADIVNKKVAALVDLYAANCVSKDVMLKELKALGEPAGMFNSITDEMIEEAKGIYSKDEGTDLHDPFGGISVPAIGATDGDGQEETGNIDMSAAVADIRKEIETASQLLEE